DGALAAHRHALTTALALAARAPDDVRLQRDVPFTHGRIAVVLDSRGDLRGALDELRTAQTLLVTLSAAHAGASESRADLADVDKPIGDALVQLGDLDGAVAQYEAARALDAALVEGDPSPEHDRNLMIALQKIGQTRRRRGERDLALDAARAALEIARRLAT